MPALFYNPWTIVLVLTGLIFVLAGYILQKYPPKSINWLYGYRTRRAMQGQEQWDFAQVFAGREMIRSGGILLVLGLAGAWLPLSDTVAVGLALGAVIICAFYPVVRVEAALKNRFEGSE
ncbi:SdpI family protein [Robiginitalea sp.]|uniref:SdpI family protein n=2 Tax=Robiginitalea sp. TaxID=1902411 RepID=UPI003C774D96